MKVFSFLREIKENSNSKKIIVSFDSTVEGYEVIDKKGNIELIGMDTHKCKLKHFEKQVKKITRKEVYKQSPEVNGLINLSLDFRPNKVLISGEKVILKKIDGNEIISITQTKNISTIQKSNNEIIYNKEKNIKNSKNQQTQNSLNNKHGKQTKANSHNKNTKKYNKNTPIKHKSKNNKKNKRKK